MSKGRNDTDMYSTSLGDITVGLNSASHTDDAGVHSYVQFMQLTLCFIHSMDRHAATVSCKPRVNITNFCGPAVVVRSSRRGVQTTHADGLLLRRCSLFLSDAYADIHHYVILTFILRMRRQCRSRLIVCPCSVSFVLHAVFLSAISTPIASKREQRLTLTCVDSRGGYIIFVDIQ